MIAIIVSPCLVAFLDDLLYVHYEEEGFDSTRIGTPHAVETVFIIIPNI